MRGLAQKAVHGCTIPDFGPAINYPVAHLKPRAGDACVPDAERFLAMLRGSEPLLTSDVTDPARPAAPVSFDALGLGLPLVKALHELGYESASPIQAAAVPVLLAGRDVLGQAQTGTGKTAAFALPALARLDRKARLPQVLVLVPTRELAIQVAQAFSRYAAHLDWVRVLPIYGGQSYGPQLTALSQGVQVVVGTPGRVIDHLDKGSLNLSGLQTLVLDEADEMLRMGFAEDVERILKNTPAQRQTALFSATMPDAIWQIAQAHLREPSHITVAAPTTTADNIRQRLCVVSGANRPDALVRVLEAEDFDAVIIFVKTRAGAEALAEALQFKGLAAQALHGDLAQAQREQLIDALRHRRLDILVATDVAARGLDVERISHVINFDPPADAESYTHRIGRTGRAGRSGEAILFIAPYERGLVRNIERATRQVIAPMNLPSPQAVNQGRIARFRARLARTLQDGHLEALTRVMDDCQPLPPVPAATLAAAILKLSLSGPPLVLEHEGDDCQYDEAPGGERESTGDAPGDLTDTLPALRPYRIEVGHASGIKPANLLAAMARECQIDAARIGRLQLFDTFSLIELPADLPRKRLRHLQAVKLGGQALNLRETDEMMPPEDPAEMADRRHTR